MGMLGKVSNRFKDGQISINWLETNFNKLPDNATEEVIQQYTRAFIMRWNHWPSYVGLLDELEDVRLLLEQRSKTEVLYVYPKIIFCIPVEVLDNREMWDANVPLISTRRWKCMNWTRVDMWGKNDEDWAENHIQAWDHRMKPIPVREPFLSANTVTTNDYLAWFRVVGKSYLLPSMAMSRQIRSNRQC
ncbi:hypothetical protein Godav_006012 [Gossypium davidsonii]|uniref:Aminotransferase-like plant mobile domain-containing protein n=1 Tax=Gossypium davidsonii TaxID=34287 RepID=A0A7J8S2B3_GOSDV|nr:hypothetical protein [Gossypium davidsonii]